MAIRLTKNILQKILANSKPTPNINCATSQDAYKNSWFSFIRTHFSAFLTYFSLKAEVFLLFVLTKQLQND